MHREEEFLLSKIVCFAFLEARLIFSGRGSILYVELSTLCFSPSYVPA